MRIVIDMQGAQTASRLRGIGRYATSFAQAVARNRGEHEVFLVLNGLLRESIETIRAGFDGFLSQDHIRVWQAPGPVRDLEAGNAARRDAAEIVRERFLASLRPDVIHLTSLFEGYVDDAVTSIGRFDHVTRVSATLFDLIPLLNPEQYLAPDPVYAAHYQRKLTSMHRAHALLAISDSAKREAIAHLSVANHRVVNVSAAIDPRFVQQAVGSEERQALFSRVGVVRPYVLYTGGIDDRKNLHRLIEAWAAVPDVVRLGLQLLLVGVGSDSHAHRYRELARSQGLAEDAMIVHGYVSDDDLVYLYNLCELFVFPSWHEGFGLPPLEAMACGAPTIGSRASSLSEVIGLEEALFDPLDVASMAGKMEQALTDTALRARLKKHGPEHAKTFSWDNTAQLAFATWTELFAPACEPIEQNGVKPRLAFVSPLPPEKTGIAGYSADLLPALASHYEIDVVIDQTEVREVDPGIRVRDVAWLRSHAHEVDRVLYQMGNSPYHQHMLSLLEEVPGVVVMHDYFMSSLMAWLETSGTAPGAWTRALYTSHGYSAVQRRMLDAEQSKHEYPANWPVLQHAKGVIFHSDHARQQLETWHPECVAPERAVIPLLRVQPAQRNVAERRQQLGIAEHAFVVCSFGFLDSSKLNHRLLTAWKSCKLGSDPECRLVFVGENHGGDYGASLRQSIDALNDRVTITGYVSQDLYEAYLAVADLAVQLRTDSRGETSAAALDCMSHGIPVIANAHGSLAELPAETVCLLPDRFNDGDLSIALQNLRADPQRRKDTGAKARRWIRENHAPSFCAEQYRSAIENAYRWSSCSDLEMIEALARLPSVATTKQVAWRLAQDMATNQPWPRPARRLYLDITATCVNDLRTGIERVVRAVLSCLLGSESRTYRIEPVYLCQLDGVWFHRHARKYTMAMLSGETEQLRDDPIDPQCGDIMLCLDISGHQLIEATRQGLFSGYRDLGLTTHAVVYDLLPIRMPEVFPPGTAEAHDRWLRSLATFDSAICISKSVAADFSSWLDVTLQPSTHERPLLVRAWHLGADVSSALPSQGMPDGAQSLLARLRSKPSFLMVGTIEPRKAHSHVIQAFSLLWNNGIDANLVIVGKEGWLGLPDNSRRTIPETMDQIRLLSQTEERLLWLSEVSDEFLEVVYQESTCLIAASVGEGFGLPLIEAARHGIPLLIRDIPVFREVAGEHASYFDAVTPEDLAESIKEWLKRFREQRHIASGPLRSSTWTESTSRLLEFLVPIST